jgi:hypothetical protein
MGRKPKDRQEGLADGQERLEVGQKAQDWQEGIENEQKT